MPKQSAAYWLLTLVRNIPEKSLQAIVSNSFYARIILGTHQALPESVFAYLANTYLVETYPGQTAEYAALLYGRPLSPPQLAGALNQEIVPEIPAVFFDYNVLTYEQLRALTSAVLNEQSALRLLQRCYQDAKAVEILIPIIPEALLATTFKNVYALPRYRGFLKKKILVLYLQKTISNSWIPKVVLDPLPEGSFPIHEPLSVVWRRIDQPSSNPTGRPCLYNADSVTKALGFEPTAWLKLLDHLDRFPDTPVGDVATAIRHAAATAPTVTIPA